jgi:hypothetical protein
MSIIELRRPHSRPTAFERASGDDIQSQNPPAAMMTPRFPKPACVQISTFLGEC